MLDGPFRAISGIGRPVRLDKSTRRNTRFFLESGRWSAPIVMWSGTGESFPRLWSMRGRKRSLIIPLVLLVVAQGESNMPSTINLYQIGVWFCVGFFTGAGWAIAAVIVGRIFAHV